MSAVYFFPFKHLNSIFGIGCFICEHRQASLPRTFHPHPKCKYQQPTPSSALFLSTETLGQAALDTSGAKLNAKPAPRLYKDIRASLKPGQRSEFKPIQVTGYQTQRKAHLTISRQTPQLLQDGPTGCSTSRPLQIQPHALQGYAGTPRQRTYPFIIVLRLYFSRRPSSYSQSSCRLPHQAQAPFSFKFPSSPGLSSPAKTFVAV